MTIIQQDHLIQSIAESLQYISYYHSPDFIKAMTIAWQKEKSPAAKDAMTQILVNSRLCAEGHRPICQDTGIVTVFLDIGMDVQWDSPDKMTVDQMVNEGVRLAYLYPDNVLRASILADPAGLRENTKDNTPAIIHTRLVAGDQVDITVAAKGGGSENKSRLVMLNPSDSIADWVVNAVSTLGAGWCPPGVLGIGIGGTSEKAMLLAKESLMQAVDIHELIEKGASNTLEALRLEIYQRVNDLGIGAQGVGGLTTALDVKILDYPTHAASLPVALVPNCAANRHLHFTLDGSGAAEFIPPDSSHWPDMDYQASDKAKKINVDNVSKAELSTLRSGDTVLLSGKILTGRDAAHKRLIELLDNNEPLPVDLKGRFIYYVGPVDPIAGEVVGPAGPTTATRMDKFTDQLLAQTGLQGMIGKAERGDAAIASIKAHQAVYLMAVGGAAYLVSKAIKSAKVVAFPELGMEAIYEFEVSDMPVVVAVDSEGEAVHKTGPQQWQKMTLFNNND